MRSTPVCPCSTSSPNGRDIGRTSAHTAPRHRCQCSSPHHALQAPQTPCAESCTSSCTQIVLSRSSAAPTGQCRPTTPGTQPHALLQRACRTTIGMWQLCARWGESSASSRAAHAPRRRFARSGFSLCARHAGAAVRAGFSVDAPVRSSEGEGEEISTRTGWGRGAIPVNRTPTQSEYSTLTSTARPLRPLWRPEEPLVARMEGRRLQADTLGHWFHSPGGQWHWRALRRLTLRLTLAGSP
jgi:hypothetical protein